MFLNSSLFNRQSQQCAISKQRGVALVTVLFMFAVVAVVLSGLVLVTQGNINRATHYIASEQAFLLCLSGEEYARQLLMDDLDTGRDIDHTHEDWAEEGLRMEVDDGYFEVTITDAQARFNINNLVGTDSANPDKQNANYKKVFANLLDFALEDKPLADKLAEQWGDWIDRDATTGTEEFDYLAADPAYRPPNAAAGSPTELRWLMDMEAESYQLIRDEVMADMVALPSGSKINVNTITPYTLAAITATPLANAESVVETIRANKAGYRQATQALSSLSPESRKAFEPYLDVKTSYFEVRVRARYGDQYSFLTTLMKRDPNGNQGNGLLDVVSRNRGQRFLFPFSEDAQQKDYNDDNAEYKIDI